MVTESSGFSDKDISAHMQMAESGRISLVTGTNRGQKRSDYLNDDIRWQGYGTADIYGAQDDCLIAIENGKPLKVDILQRIPPWRATLVASIAEKAGTGLEKGTYEQLAAEAKAVGGNGKLGEWWKRNDVLSAKQDKRPSNP